MRRHGPLALLMLGTGMVSLGGSGVEHSAWWLFMSVAGGLTVGTAFRFAGRQR